MPRYPTNNCHYVPKYCKRLDSISMYKRSLCLYLSSPANEQPTPVIAHCTQGICSYAAYTRRCADFFFLYIYLACNYRPLCNSCTYCMFGTKVLLWKRHYSDVGWRKVTSDDDVSFVQLKKKRKTHQPLKKWVYTARKNKKRKARRPARGMGTSSDGYRRREEDDRYFVIYRPLESSCGIFTVYSGIPENRIPVFCFGVSRYSTTSNNGTWRYKYRNFLGLLTITLTIVSALRAARCRWYRVRRSIIRGVRIHTTRTRYRVHSSTSMVVWYEVPPYIEFD